MNDDADDGGKPIEMIVIYECCLDFTGHICLTFCYRLLSNVSLKNLHKKMSFTLTECVWLFSTALWGSCNGNLEVGFFHF